MKRGTPMKRTAIARGESKLTTSKPLRAKSAMKRGDSQLARASKPMKAVGERAKRTRQGKVAPNAIEQAWMDKVREFGCIVCWKFHGARTPAAVHHILAGGRRMGHLFTIGLCDPGHHQGGTRGVKISRHPDKARFEEAYGTEIELLKLSKDLLA